MLYFYHIRKTGGTSFIALVLAQTGVPEIAYRAIAADGYYQREHRRYEGWTTAPRPDTDFAWSHEPARDIQLPELCETITILRDPVERVISFYRMLLHDSLLDKMRLPREHKYLGTCLWDCTSRLPATKLFRQIEMFSQRHDVSEAADCIMQVDYRLRLESFDALQNEVCASLGVKPIDVHITGLEKLQEPNIEQVEECIAREYAACKDDLRELMDPEYHLLSQLLFSWGE